MRMTYGKALLLGAAIVLAATPAGWSQQNAPVAKPAAQAPKSDPASLTVDVVGRLFSEDRSNLRDYWPALEQRTKDSWLAAMPDEAQPPQSTAGTVRIFCVVHTDGSVSGMTLEQKSGKAALDRAAWAAITGSAPYDPFPSGISTDHVKVRFTFVYNGGTQATPLGKKGPTK
ncbi:MAG: TonB family protein [Acidobacteriaceae bacterium]